MEKQRRVRLIDDDGNSERGEGEGGSERVRQGYWRRRRGE